MREERRRGEVESSTYHGFAVGIMAGEYLDSKLNRFQSDFQFIHLLFGTYRGRSGSGSGSGSSCSR